jgi:hypothetical protein
MMTVLEGLVVATASRGGETQIAEALHSFTGNAAIYKKVCNRVDQW